MADVILTGVTQQTVEKVYHFLATEPFLYSFRYCIILTLAPY